MPEVRLRVGGLMGFTMGDVCWATGTNGLTAASLFAGCGGSSLGYRLAGFDVRYANELDPYAAETYELNASVTTTVDRRSVVEVTGEDIARACDGVPDVLDGSPPCQDASLAGRRNAAGQNARLYYDAVRLVRELGPPAFAFENVRGFVLGEFHALHFTPIFRTLTRYGYRVRARVLNASYFGVPQARERSVLMGFREDLGIDPADVFPTPQRQQTLMRDALPHAVELVQSRPADQPARTIVTGGISALGPAQVATEAGRRRPGMSDYRALQSFPPDFEFPDGAGRARRLRMIGNSVPPLLARAWSTAMAEALLNARVAAA